MEKPMDMPAEQMDDAACKLVAEFFAVYAHPIRISILCALSQGPKTVTELANHANVTLQNVSQHLRIMRDKGAVRTVKSGQRVIYSVAHPKFLMGVRLIRDAVVEQYKSKVGTVTAPEAIEETPAPSQEAL